MDVCQEIIQSCKHYEASSLELRKLMTDAMAAHLYQEGQSDRSISLWVAPSSLGGAGGRGVSGSVAKHNEKLSIPSHCYHELLGLKSSAEVDWYDELDDMAPAASSAVEEGQ